MMGLTKCDNCGNIGWGTCGHTRRPASDEEAIALGKRLADSRLSSMIGLGFDDLADTFFISDYVSPDMEKKDFMSGVRDMCVAKLKEEGMSIDDFP